MDRKDHEAAPAPPSHWRRWGPVVLVLVAAAVAIFVLKVNALTVGLVGAMLAMHLFMPHGAGHGAGQSHQADEKQAEAGHGSAQGHHAGDPQAGAAPQDGSCCGGVPQSKPQTQETQDTAPKK